MQKVALYIQEFKYDIGDFVRAKTKSKQSLNSVPLLLFPFHTAAPKNNPCSSSISPPL